MNLLTSLLMTSLVLISGSQTKARTVTVCELLQDLRRYQDQHISLRGEWVHTEHGTYIRQQCPVSVMTEAHRWPNAIWIQFPWLETDRPVKTRFDKRNLDIAQSKIDKLMGKSQPRVPIYATVSGVFQTRQPPQATKRSDGGTIGNGFGHLNSFVGQIVPSSIDHISSREE